MKHWLFALVLGICATGGSAQEPGDAVQDVIRDQIEAFQADDFGRAFTYASPMIQSLFGSPERFGQMVRQGYPMVWRPSDLRFLNLRAEAGRLWQRIEVTDDQGRSILLDYQMVPGPEGWLINGVQFVQPPVVGV